MTSIISSLIQENISNAAISRLNDVEDAQQENPLGNFVIVRKILKLLYACNDLQTLGRLAGVNPFLNLCVRGYDEQLDLKRLCPQLRILDAKAQKMTVADAPRISKLRILDCYNRLAPCVKDEAGLTLLTMPKGCTLNHLVAIAKENGMILDVEKQIMQKLGDISVEQTYVIMITNNVFKESQDKNYALQQELVAKHGCEMPAIQELLALCVFTYQVFRECLYGQTVMQYGHSSTLVQDYPLMIGGFAPPTRLCRKEGSAPVNLSIGRSDGSAVEYYGASGQQKL